LIRIGAFVVVVVVDTIDERKVKRDNGEYSVQMVP
jgi:hypothetical protein